MSSYLRSRAIKSTTADKREIYQNTKRTRRRHQQLNKEQQMPSNINSHQEHFCWSQHLLASRINTTTTTTTATPTTILPSAKMSTRDKMSSDTSNNNNHYSCTVMAPTRYRRRRPSETPSSLPKANIADFVQQTTARVATYNCRSSLTALLVTTTLLCLLISPLCCLASLRVDDEAKAEPLISGSGQADPATPTTTSTPTSDSSNQNVILIKYANVSSDQPTSDPTIQQQPTMKLNVFQLVNEPLSVPVIESRFSHSIQLFDVSHNQLSTLSKDLFCPLSNEVRQLNISHNLLENFDCLGLISQAGQLCLSELRVLDMSYNLIKHLPATGVATLHNLEILNLSHNLIESLDELSLSSLFKLTKLDLSYNRIQQLPMRIFHKSHTMQVLWLQGNYLRTNISQMSLAGLISLEELDLSFNSIDHVFDLAFMDKPNLTRVDLSHNQLGGLRQEALRVATTGASVIRSNHHLGQQQQQPIYKPRLHHNGQYAGLTQITTTTTTANGNNDNINYPRLTQFYLSSNAFICDCQLDWMRKFQPSATTRGPTPSWYNRAHQGDPNWFSSSSSSSSSSSKQKKLSFGSQLVQQQPPLSETLQNDQPSVIQTTSSSSNDLINNISENNQSGQQQQQQQAASNNQPHYGRIADLDLIKCSPLFRRSSHLNRVRSRTMATPSNGAHNNHHGHQVHHPNNHLHHQNNNNNHHHNHHNHPAAASINRQPDTTMTSANNNMIDLLTADSSNFLCRYKNHCFAECHCCDFDACDCEMICPAGCQCYYDSIWHTNIIDCSSNNHTVVPDRIPMDVSGLYLDGNNIDSLRPSNLIARTKLKTLFLNATNLQFIANRTFNGLIELQTLYLNDNQLRTLNGYEFEPLAQLRALYLQSNRLDFINNQTFIYLRSLEILDLSNNRLTSMNLDLFTSIGHHNIRLRQLSIAHNWWSCQCSSINRFRQILKQKFLLNGSGFASSGLIGGASGGGVNIVDRNQLRCYYNSTTVGPLILADGMGAQSLQQHQQQQQQPIFGSFPQFMQSSNGNQNNNNNQLTAAANRQQQQQLLTEIDQCSELIDESQVDPIDLNPPMIVLPPAAEFPLEPATLGDYPGQQPSQSSSSPPQHQPPPPPPPPAPADLPSDDEPAYPARPMGNGLDVIGGPTGYQADIVNNNNHLHHQHHQQQQQTVPMTSVFFFSILCFCILIVALSIFVFVKQQQRFHHKKSSAASTTSVSSSASSTAISSSHTSKMHRHHHHQHPTLATGHHSLHHHHHNNQLIIGSNGQPNGGHHHQQLLHHHSASSQSSNIYAALVSPTGSSTIVTSTASHPNNANNILHHQQQNNNNNNGASNNNNANNNNLYSNSSTTASHHSTSSVNGQQPPNVVGPNNHWRQQQQQQLYGQMQLHYGHLENPYMAASQTGAYSTNNNNNNNNKTSLGATGSLYNVHHASNLMSTAPSSNCHEATLTRGGGGVDIDGATGNALTGGDWIKLPKVKQFMSKLVNKSLALGGYRASSSRDDLSGLPTSDKIYDAFLSYDKRDEQFVRQHLFAELEYGQPQYRIADRFRDLPAPSSAYIGEAITSVIGCSHRTIIVLTENYLTSEWCRFELQAALRESSVDRAHRLIAVVLDPKCLLDMDQEMRALLTSNVATQLVINQPQLVQLADGGAGSQDAFQQQQQQQQLLATLSSGRGPNQVVSHQPVHLATSKINFINFNERKFWPKLKQMMPTARPPTQTLTLTTKN